MFSPDGTSVAYVSWDDLEGGHLWLMHLDEDVPRRLTEHPGDDSHPHWSADGERIIFNSPRPTPDLSVGWLEQWHEVFSMKPDGSDLKRLTNSPGEDWFPAWSPNGHRIAYATIRGSRNRDVLTIAADGGVPTVFSGHQAATRRRTHGGSGQGVREVDAVASNPINVGSIVQPISIRTYRLVSMVVTHNEYDVRPLFRCWSGNIGATRQHSE